MGIIDKILVGPEEGTDTSEIRDDNLRRLEEEERKRQELDAQKAEESEVPPERAPAKEAVPEKTMTKDEEELLKFMQETAPKIYVIGTGGSGCNTISRMVAAGGVYGARIFAMNTDAQHLFRVASVERKVLLGKKKTKGLGAGSNPEVGEAAAQESSAEIKTVLQDADLVFVTCGMGGGTGTGSAHVIAKAAKDNGALVVGIVTMPFTSEGSKRMDNALIGLQKLREAADTTIAIPNDKLLLYVPDLPLNQAFKASDEVLMNAVRGIAELVTKPGLVNLDFADLRTILHGAGMAVIGLGENTQHNGRERVVDAAKKALSSPLLDLDVGSADKALINITGGEDMTLGEAEAAVNAISGKIAKEAHVIWGANVDKALTGKGVRVLAVLSGINDGQAPKKQTEQIEETLTLDFIT